MMQRVFRGKLEATDDVLIKYKDEGVPTFLTLQCLISNLLYIFL